ncbi:MAG: hypothetical protein AAFV69_02985 [Pseudomonadota bacterium]
MMKNAAALIVGATVLWTSGPAQARDLTVLGTVRADFSRDRDEVENPKVGQRFWGLELAAKRGAITLESVSVRFGNGKTQTYKVDRRFNTNSRPVIIDFDTRRGRFVDEVTVIHQTRKSRDDRQAVLQIAGDRAPRRGRGNSGIDWRKNWEALGATQVRSRTDDREIAIPRGIGRIGVVGLVAETRPVYVSSVTVRYRDGSRNRYRPETLIRPGDPIYKIKLERARRVQTVDVIYRGRKRDRDYGNGRMLILTKLQRDRIERPRKQPKGWVLIGTAKAAVLSKDYDAIQIGKQAGRFKAIRITARRQDIRMYGMRVTYGNGTQENVPVYGWIRKNQTSNTFDLKGRDRFIKTIEFRYRTKLSFKGSGKIEVEGLR